MKTYQYVVAALFGAFLCVSVFYPNVFGNQPDAIADESYFLTSALQSVQQHTLPGWEFSASGAYYGGVQAYVDTAALVPVLAVEFVLQGHSVGSLKLWVALHTGGLLHVLRLVNGAAFLGTLFLLAYYLLRRGVPQPLMQRFLLLATLLFGNSLVVMLAHTAKVWVFYMILEILAGVLVLTQEYYLRERAESFLSTPIYVGLLLWLAVAAFFQTFVGAFTAGLWLLWAWWLGHFTLVDMWRYVRTWWYLFIFAGLTQVSFFWRAFFARSHGSILDLQGAHSGEVGIDWAHRFLVPLYNAFFSQPFIAVYVALVALLLVPHYRRALPYSRRYITIALVHPVLVYLFFYPLIGFDSAARYAVLLAVACSFSIVMLMPRGKMYAALSAGAAVLAVAVLFHAAQLYWTPSYQAQLVARIEQDYNATTTAVVVDTSAIEFQLPMNSNSLQHLDSTGKSMSRYAYLLENLPQVSNIVPFHSLVLYARAPEERDLMLAQAKKEGYSVYLVSLPRGEGNSAEPDTLTTFFKTERIGFPYVLGKNLP
jgi:hypothetical protein